MKALLVLVFVFVAGPLSAQEAVNRAADWASWATAAVNPTAAVINAVRSENPKCELGRFLISEGIGLPSAFVLQHFVLSPRPCLGCAPHGMPSAHAAQSVIGISSQWSYGVYFSVGTAQLRTVANRHTPLQVAAGLALGGVSEWAGQKALRCHS